MKITVNQLRRIIREEIEKTVHLNEIYDEDEPVSLEQKEKLDKIVKFPDLSKMFTQEEMANALINKNYKVIPQIMGVDTFDNFKVWDALSYMFPEMKKDRQTYRSWRETWDLAGPLANIKGMTLSRQTPQDSPSPKLK